MLDGSDMKGCIKMEHRYHEKKKEKRDVKKYQQSDTVLDIFLCS